MLVLKRVDTKLNGRLHYCFDDYKLFPNQRKGVYFLFKFINSHLAAVKEFDSKLFLLWLYIICLYRTVYAQSIFEHSNFTQVHLGSRCGRNTLQYNSSSDKLSMHETILVLSIYLRPDIIRLTFKIPTSF